MKTRKEHLVWCKARALEYCDKGEVADAFTSMTSDLQRHPETANHVGTKLGIMMMAVGSLTRPQDMRRFIEGFN